MISSYINKFFPIFRKKNVKHKSFKSKISCFNPEKKNIKNELQLFRNEFSDKLEKNLQKFQRYYNKYI